MCLPARNSDRSSSGTAAAILTCAVTLLACLGGPILVGLAASLL
jgi:hypothetical protein